MQADPGPEPQVPGGGNRVVSPWPSFFTSQTIAEAMEVLVPAEQFLLQTFFPTVRYFPGRFLTVSVRKQKRVIAPVISRYSQAVPLERPTTSVTSFDVPVLAPSRILHLAMLDARSPAEVVAGDAGQYAASVISTDTEDCVNTCRLRTEQFAASILYEGKVRYRLDGGEFEEFGYPGMPTVLDASPTWDNAATCTPIDDLAAARSMIVTATGLVPDVCILSEQSARCLFASRQVREQLDVLRLVQGQIQPRRPIGSAQWLGRLLYPALELYSYGGMYLDELDGSTPTPFCPPWTALIGVSGGGTTWYGSIIQLTDDGYEEIYGKEFVPRLHFNVGSETGELRVKSRPLICPQDVMATVVLRTLPYPSPHKRKPNGGPSIPAEESQPQRPNHNPKKG